MMNLVLLPMAALSLATAGTSDGPSFTAEVSGSIRTVLTGYAVFGPVRGAASDMASFSMTLGAYSDNGAVVFSRVGTERPKTGTYQIRAFMTGGEDADEFHALVSLGSPTNPLGAFRAVSGTVTITKSGSDQIVGRYELKAVGFMAADMDNEEREITVRGSFAATPSETPASFEAAMAGALTSRVAGDGEFGVADSHEGSVFSIALGATGNDGAILLSRTGAQLPSSGSYRLTEWDSAADAQWHGLIITGSPSHPSGVFRVTKGTITITSASTERMVGTFEMQAAGFLAEDMDNESRTLTVSGAFNAKRER
jgi:hypothetical protein